MAERLTFENFFTKPYILDPRSQDLDAKDHNKALFYSVILGVFTLGLVHLGYATQRTIKSWCFKSTNLNHPTNSKLQSAATKVITEKKPDVVQGPSPEEIAQEKTQLKAQFLAICAAIEKRAEDEQGGTLIDENTSLDLKRALSRIISYRTEKMKDFFKEFTKTDEYLLTLGKDSYKRKFSSITLVNIKLWANSPNAPGRQDVYRIITTIPSLELLALCFGIRNADCLSE